jgi:hypothetical protein
LVALAGGWFLLVSSMTALVIGAVTGLSQHMSPFLSGLLVGVPLAAGSYALVRYGWTGIKGLGRDKAEQQAIDEGTRP